MNSTHRQYDDEGIYDGVLFGGSPQTLEKSKTREKKSFLSHTAVGSVDQTKPSQDKSSFIKTVNTSDQLEATSNLSQPETKAKSHEKVQRPVSSAAQENQQKQSQTSAVQLAYQKKVELHNMAQRAQELRRKEFKKRKAQALEQEALQQKEMTQQRVEQLPEQKRQQQQQQQQLRKQQEKQKIAQDKSREIYESQQKYQKLQESNKQKQRERQQVQIHVQPKVSHPAPKSTPHRHKWSPHTISAQQYTPHQEKTKIPQTRVVARQKLHNQKNAQGLNPQTEDTTSRWRNISAKGISLQEQQEKKIQAPSYVNQSQRLRQSDRALFATKRDVTTEVSLPKVGTTITQKKKSPQTQPRKILTQKSNSFFENVSGTSESSKASSFSQKIKRFFSRVLSISQVIQRKPSLAQVSKNSSPAQTNKISLPALFAAVNDSTSTNSLRNTSFRFALFGLISLTAFGSLLFMGHALATKDRVEDSADAAIEKLQGAANFARSGDFQKAFEDIENAHRLFLQADEQISSINQAVVRASRYIPGASRLASGDALVSASVHISQSLTEMSQLTAQLDLLQQAASGSDLNDFSILDVSNRFFSHIKIVHEQLRLANEYIIRVHIDDVPEGQRDQFIQLRRTIEPLTSILEQTVELEGAISELLGSEGTRKYLFLFQNNQEMRASGGFIGSYGFLDMNAGRIREFKIDGIYNPGGQLTDKVVPPRPIQKISAAWSLHDSNWWPDFPKSAEKAMDFYARTGGPSVDGVIAVTPVMIERLLEVTGPIALPEYDVTLTAKNFVEMTRQEIESEAHDSGSDADLDSPETDTNTTNPTNTDLDFDQEESPKQILSDLMPVLMGELKKDLSREKGAQLLSVILSGLDERQILIYMRNEQVRSIIEKKKWGGRILEAQDDYLSVVHSNINGFKTDGVIDDVITHESHLNKDGRIVNRVTIERTHNGGNTGYQWWDAVNANYMRVYVPEGSRLISATGYTPEWHEPRLDYEALGFEIDEDVFLEESNVYVDPDSGTRVYADSGKTVFGNWVYVSPGEKVTVIYEYELPWSFTTRKDESGSFSSYDVLYQKQAGAQNSRIKSAISLDENMYIVARIPQRSSAQDTNLRESVHEQDFKSDLYQGVVFRIEQ